MIFIVVNIMLCIIRVRSNYSFMKNLPHKPLTTVGVRHFNSTCWDTAGAQGLWSM